MHSRSYRYHQCKHRCSRKGTTRTRRCPLHSFLHLLCIDLCWSNKTLFVHVCHYKGKAFYNNLYPQENHFHNCSFHKSGHKYNVHQFDSCPGRVHISLWSSNNWQYLPLCPHSLKLLYSSFIWADSCKGKVWAYWLKMGYFFTMHIFVLNVTSSCYENGHVTH